MSQPIQTGSTRKERRGVGDRRNSVERSILLLMALRRFSGPPQAFWQAYLSGVGGLCLAVQGGILIKSGGETGWQSLQVWQNDERKPQTMAIPSEDLLEKTVQEGFVIKQAETGREQQSPGLFLMRLDVGPGQPLVIIALVPRQPVVVLESIQEAAFRLKLVADIPSLYQQGREYQQSQRDIVRIAEVLDLSGRLQADKTFSQAVMTLCNELVGQFECSQVSLGWLEKEGYVRLQAISHMVKFDRKTVMAQGLESAMEESLDQDSELLWPPPDDRREITLAHKGYAEDRALNYVVTLPIRHAGQPVGALTCERSSEPFSAFDVWSLRLFIDHTLLRIVELKRNDRWFVAKWADGATKQLQTLVGPQHVVLKVLGLTVSLVLMTILLSSWPYRVDAPFLLKTDDSFILPAPFDGFIEDVFVREGDIVEKGRRLAVLDSRDLLLEKNASLAELTRFALESEKARREGVLAEMRIAQARRDQAALRHERLAYQIEKASLLSPMTGVVVEGDLKKQIGAPVRRGDTLFQIASLDDMYVTMEVDERDVHEIRREMAGEMAFIGRPEQRFALRVEQINPLAEVRDGRNVFMVRGAVVSTERVGWWRPGMSGVAKLMVGERPLVWILTHRTVEFLHMLTWW